MLSNAIQTDQPAIQPKTEFGLHRIGQIAVIARDVARATRFYRDVLGMHLLFEAPPGLAFFDCGGIRLMLSPPEGADTASASSILYYTVPDIRAAYDTLVTRGVQFEDAPHVVAALADRDVWMAFLRDSEHNLLALMSEVPRAGNSPPDGQ
ncbi:MAG: VOC family protein [Gemmatimonadaceae bacterium]